jgi:peptide/nickel transport system permease protein
MGEAVQSIQLHTKSASNRKSVSTFGRVARYTLVRAITLFLTVVVGVFLTIIVANMGGYLDELRLAEIIERITQEANLNPVIRSLEPEARQTWIDERIALEVKKYGLLTLA